MSDLLPASNPIVGYPSDTHDFSSPTVVSGDDFDPIDVEFNIALDTYFEQDPLSPRCFDIDSTSQTEGVISDQVIERVSRL